MNMRYYKACVETCPTGTYANFNDWWDKEGSLMCDYEPIADAVSQYCATAVPKNQCHYGDMLYDSRVQNNTLFCASPTDQDCINMYQPIGMYIGNHKFLTKLTDKKWANTGYNTDYTGVQNYSTSDIAEQDMNGEENSSIIKSVSGANAPAFYSCGNGYIPALGEIMEMQSEYNTLSRAKRTKLESNVLGGGFYNVWTSTPASNSEAWAFTSSGALGTLGSTKYSKQTSMKVFCIRSF